MGELSMNLHFRKRFAVHCGLRSCGSVTAVRVNPNRPKRSPGQETVETSSFIAQNPRATEEVSRLLHPKLLSWGGSKGVK